ncbi:MAG: hypothetical protein K6T31_01900 [Alicyclobacillus sp.]|nr:hypothetical protein [Alicyclobacillus sp.]
MSDRMQLLCENIAELRSWLRQHADTAPVRVVALVMTDLHSLERALKMEEEFSDSSCIPSGWNSRSAG